MTSSYLISIFIPSLARYEETSFHKLNSNIIFRKIKKSNTRKKKTARKSLQFAFKRLRPCPRTLSDVGVAGYQRFDQVFRLQGIRHQQ